MRRFLIFALFAVAAFGGGYWLGRRNVEVVRDAVIRIDTVFYARPQPVSISDRLVTINVPRVLFAPRDTIIIATDPVSSRDSVQMQVPIETRIYEDSTYRAQVSGPALGHYRPTLDWVRTYNTTLTRTVAKRNRFAITAGVGAAYTPQGIQPTVGVQVGVVLWGF